MDTQLINTIESLLTESTFKKPKKELQGEPEDYVHIYQWLEQNDLNDENDPTWLNEITQSKYKIEEFLMNLHDIKKKLIFNNYQNMKESIQEVKRVKGVIQALQPEFDKKEEYVREVQNRFGDKIKHLTALKNSIKAENLVRKAQLLFKALQQINLTPHPLSLSIILRENRAIFQSKEDFKGIIEIEKRLDSVQKIEDELRRNTEARFHEAFEAKDQSTMKTCVQIFFNMEILNEKIQTVANNVLRSLFTMWKKTIANCQEKIGTFIKSEEELKFISNEIKTYSSFTSKYTLQIYTLCISLRERNSRSYETLEESLQNSGLNNLFNLFWNRVCRIYSQSILKLGENSNYTQQVVQKVFIENYPIFYKCHFDFWTKFCSETVPRSQIVFSELKLNLFDSIAQLKNGYLQKADEMFKNMLEKIHTKLAKKTNDIISCKIALKETRNVCKKITQIFNTLQDDEIVVNQLYKSFTGNLTGTLNGISELIVEMDFVKDFQFNHTIWQVINTIRKTLVGIKSGDKLISEGTTFEIDALKRNIENILFNSLQEEIKTGIKKMLRAYKTIELGDSEDKTSQYAEVSNSFISTFFNQKISDFASASKDLFNDKNAMRSKEILVDTLDFFMVQFLCLDIKDPDLRKAVSKDLQLFPNLFNPLFKIYSSTRICVKTQKISQLLEFPLGLNNVDKLSFVQNEFLSQKSKFVSDFGIIVALVMETLALWEIFDGFYVKGEIEEGKEKNIGDYKQIGSAGDDLLRAVKYDRNIIKQTNKIFWKDLTPEEISDLPIDQNIISVTIQSYDQVYSKFKDIFTKFIQSYTEMLAQSEGINPKIFEILKALSEAF